MFFESVCIVVFGSGCAQSIGVNSVDGAAGLHLRTIPLRWQVYFRNAKIKERERSTLVSSKCSCCNGYARKTMSVRWQAACFDKCDGVQGSSICAGRFEVSNVQFLAVQEQWEDLHWQVSCFGCACCAAVRVPVTLRGYCIGKFPCSGASFGCTLNRKIVVEEGTGKTQGRWVCAKTSPPFSRHGNK